MKNSSPFAFGRIFGVLFILLAVPEAVEAAQFAAKNRACTAKAWNGSAWGPVDGVTLAGREIDQVTPPSKGHTRFKVAGVWYQAQSACITGARSPASLQSQSVTEVKRVSDQAKADGYVLRGALEYAGFSRTLGFGGKDYRVSIKTTGAKAGFGARSFLNLSSFYWGWNVDGFFGISSVSAEAASPVAYEASGVLTLGGRGSGAIGYQMTSHLSAQLDLGLGLSYAGLQKAEVPSVTSPSSMSLFPLLKLGGVYQTDSSLGFGLELMSQGLMKDFAFSGGVQWVL